MDIDPSGNAKLCASKTHRKPKICLGRKANRVGSDI
jgi:hypothetical protein